MGATLVALFIRGDEAYIAEVGDSRGYLLRKGRLRQITRDQSLVQLLVDQGVMTPDEARASPSKNVILQAMGLAKDVRVAIARLRLRAGDRFVLCSDGITNPVSDPELQKILTDSEPRAACETMIALANDRGGDDNQTAIVADLTNVAQAAADKIRAKSASKPPPMNVVVEDQPPTVATTSDEAVPEAVPERVSSEKKAIVVDEAPVKTMSAAKPSSTASEGDAPTRIDREPSERARSIHSTEPRIPMQLIIAAAITIVVILLFLLR
jgi:hypothetical protein